MSETNVVFNSVESFVVGITRALVVLCGAFLVLMMVHVGSDIAMKLLFNAPITGTLETVSYFYMVSIVFLALPFVELRHEHVSVDLFFQRFPPGLQIIVYALGALLSAAYYGLFCYQTTIDALKATAERETVMSNFIFYVWPSRWALSIGSGILVLAILLNGVRAILKRQIPELGMDTDAAS
ncbi:MAG: C4-dicarboxylate ABC transporter permease [Sneathiella sp.]|nr:MAG: C4-dicarboxylate ABC transporter permease [Sneathiella sp.]